jgi:quercetin dioxygenase-like cupin family protein
LHRTKDETFYLLSGEAWVDSDEDGDLVRVRMVAGQSFRIPPGAPHRFEAITDCLVLEVSTPVHNDRVRLEEHYDVEVHGPYGLETTES